MENERIPGYEDPDGHIDIAETKNNYHLVYPKGSYKTLISPYIYPCGGGKRQNGSIVSVVVSADEDYFELRGEICEREFFRDAARFFIDRYTLKNVFSAIVHVDEGVHHMHLNFLPYDDEGKLMPIGRGDRDAMRELQDDFYESVGRRWNLEKGENESGIKKVVRNEYLHQRQMFLHGIELHNRLEQLQDTRTEIREAEESLEDRKEVKRKLNIEIRDLTEVKEALTEDIKSLRAKMLEETDLHSFMETACAQPDPSKDKDESLRILKARNALMQQQMVRQQKDTEEIFTRMQAAETQAKEAEATINDIWDYCNELKAGNSEEQKYCLSLFITDELRAFYPEIYRALVNEYTPDTAKFLDDDKDSRDKAGGKDKAE